MISFQTLRGQMEAADAVLLKYKQEGEFSLTAGDFASKVAPSLGLDKEAAALAKAIGSDTAVFKFRARTNGSSLVPIAVTPGVFMNGTGPVAVSADLARIDGVEFLQHRLGPGGYVVAKIGNVEVQLPLVVSDELRDDLIAARNDGQEPPQYEETAGAPPVEIESPFKAETMIPTMKPVPQRDLPPWSAEVPHLTDLEIVEILEPSRQYKSPRVTVRLENGSTIVGLICSQPIVRAVMNGEGELTEAAVGQKFQILDVEERRRRDGELVKGENGEVQRTVLVRLTTKPLSFEL
jgi:hypothetical protein